MKKIKLDKTKIVAIVAVTVSAAIGIVSGVIIGQDVFREKVDYSKLDIAELEDDVDALYKKYEKTDSSKYESTFKPYELVNIGYKKISTHESFYTVGKGEVNAAGIIQTIRSNYVKNNDDMFFENISASSLVQVAWRFYQTDETVDIYEGKYQSTESASYSDNKVTNSTKTEYNNTWGKDLTRPTIYIISSKTVTNSEVKIEGDKFKVSLDLNPKTAVARYVKQMCMTSGLKKDPTFQEVHIDYTLDKDLNLLESSINEHYEVSMFGTHDSIGTLVETFTYDIEKSIPSISENATY